MKLINSQEIVEGLQRILHRFPATITFLSILNLWTLLLVWDFVNLDSNGTGWFSVTSDHSAIIFYYLCTASVLDVVMNLLGEEMHSQRRFKAISLTVHALLCINALVLWNLPEESITESVVVAQTAFTAALFICGIFLPFFREKDDIASWNFTLRMGVFAVLCTFACCIVSIGLVGLLWSIDRLFDISVDNRWNFTILTLMMLAVAPCIWLSRLPEKSEKYDRKAQTWKFLSGIVRWLFLPLVLLYMAVLYVYVIRIAFLTELPRGGVCWMVNAFMLGFVAIVILLYPQQHASHGNPEDARSFELRAMRWMPFLALPLLVLMSIAIGRRIMDYGITVNRLYMATLHLWFYGVCIGLILFRGHRIHWIPLSFAALAFVTSSLPVNFYSITRHSILSKIERTLSEHGNPALPMDQDNYDIFTKSLKKKNAVRLSGQLLYLEKLGYDKDVRKFVTKDTYVWQSINEEESVRTIAEFNSTGMVQVPEGFTRFQSFSTLQQNVEDNHPRTWILEDENGNVYHIELPNVEKYKGEDMQLRFYSKDREAVLCVTEFVLSETNYSNEKNYALRLEGYTFEK